MNECASLSTAAYLAKRSHARRYSARPVIFNLKIRTPSGAVNVGVKQSERRGAPWGGVFPLRGPEERTCLSAGRLPATRGVAPVPPVIGLLDASVEYTEFVAAGVARPAGGVRATSPARGTPHPREPRASRAPQRSERSRPHVRRPRRRRSWLPDRSGATRARPSTRARADRRRPRAAACLRAEPRRPARDRHVDAQPRRQIARACAPCPRPRRRGRGRARIRRQRLAARQRQTRPGGCATARRCRSAPDRRARPGPASVSGWPPMRSRQPRPSRRARA